jgi:1,4-dihydroxy-2-naphthoyl-CoA synthase
MILPPATQFVTYSIDDHIATITFNRPDRLNALLPDMIHTYSDLLDFADADPQVRAIVVTGAGRGFCSGADLSILGEDPELVQGFLQGQSHKTVPGKYLHLSTPVITAINGPAAGLGFVIAMISASQKMTPSLAPRFLDSDSSLSTELLGCSPGWSDLHVPPKFSSVVVHLTDQKHVNTG